MMTTNASKKKKILAIALIAIFSVFIIIPAGINSYLEGVIRDKIQTQINQKPGSLYHLAVDDMDIHLFRGRLSLHQMMVEPTDSAIQRLQNGHIKMLSQVQINEFSIGGSNILRFLNGKDIKIRNISATNVSIEYLINKNAHSETKEQLAMQDVLAGIFRSATVDKLYLQNVAFRFMDDLHDTLSGFGIDSVVINIKDIFLDQNTLKNLVPVSFAEFNLKAGIFEFNTLTYYKIKTNDILFRMADSTVNIDGFRFQPKFSKEEYNRLIEYNDDWFDIAADRIIFQGFSLYELQFNSLLHLVSVGIESPDIQIYRDKNLPDAPFKYKPLLAGLIKKIPLPFYIDTLKVKNGKLVYEEQTPISNTPGMVFFDPLFLSAYDITNQPYRIALKNQMEVNFHGRIMGTSKLNANLKINLSSDYEKISASGFLESVDASAFNPMVENLLLVSIKEGKVQKAQFHLNATDDLSQGELFLDYEDIKVEVHKHKDSEKKSGAMTFVANEILNTNNLPEDRRYRTGTIYFERRKDKGLVNYLWNSAKTGIVSIIAPIADKTKKEKKQAGKEKKRMRKIIKRIDQEVNCYFFSLKNLLIPLTETACSSVPVSPIR